MNTGLVLKDIWTRKIHQEIHHMDYVYVKSVQLLSTFFNNFSTVYGVNLSEKIHDEIHSISFVHVMFVGIFPVYLNF